MSGSFLSDTELDSWARIRNPGYEDSDWSMIDRQSLLLSSVHTLSLQIIPPSTNTLPVLLLTSDAGPVREQRDPDPHGSFVDYCIRIL